MVVAYGWGSTERVKFDLITIYRGMDNHNLLQHQLSKHNYGVKIVEWKRKLHVYIYYVASSLKLAANKRVVSLPIKKRITKK